MQHTGFDILALTSAYAERGNAAVKPFFAQCGAGTRIIKN